MKVGDKASISRRYAAADITSFLNLGQTGLAGVDHVPEPLIGGLFSYLLGVKLPGFGTNYLKQETRFLAPAPLDAELTATVEITRLRPEKHLCDLATVCTDAGGRVIAEGRALVLIKDVGADA